MIRAGFTAPGRAARVRACGPRPVPGPADRVASAAGARRAPGSDEAAATCPLTARLAPRRWLRRRRRRGYCGNGRQPQRQMAARRHGETSSARRSRRAGPGARPGLTNSPIVVKRRRGEDGRGGAGLQLKKVLTACGVASGPAVFPPPQSANGTYDRTWYNPDPTGAADYRSPRYTAGGDERRPYPIEPARNILRQKVPPMSGPFIALGRMLGVMTAVAAVALAMAASPISAQPSAAGHTGGLAAPSGSGFPECGARQLRVSIPAAIARGPV